MTTRIRHGRLCIVLRLDRAEDLTPAYERAVVEAELATIRVLVRREEPAS